MLQTPANAVDSVKEALPKEGAVFGSIFMVVVMELLPLAVTPLADYFPQLLMDFAYIKDMAFGWRSVLF